MGITAKKLALTIALGFVIGIMPFIGLATLVCTLLGWRLRLNIPAMLLICYLAGPFHLLFYIPFIQVGIWVFGMDEFRMSFDQILVLFKENWLLALEKVWLANMLGMMVWMFLTVPLTAVIYYSLLPVLRKYIKPVIITEVNSD